MEAWRAYGAGAPASALIWETREISFWELERLAWGQRASKGQTQGPCCWTGYRLRAGMKHQYGGSISHGRRKPKTEMEPVVLYKKINIQMALVWEVWVHVCWTTHIFYFILFYFYLTLNWSPHGEKWSSVPAFSNHRITHHWSYWDWHTFSVKGQIVNIVNSASLSQLLTLPLQ